MITNREKALIISVLGLSLLCVIFIIDIVLKDNYEIDIYDKGSFNKICEGYDGLERVEVTKTLQDDNKYFYGVSVKCSDGATIKLGESNNE